MDRHQAEPWSQQGVTVVGSDGVLVATAATLDDARRIVAAVNAVLGIPTAALEGGVVAELLAGARTPESDLKRAERELESARVHRLRGSGTTGSSQS